MKALLWKEWRESTRWAVLAALVFGVCEVAVLRRPYQPRFGGDGIGLCRATFLSLTVYGSALIGLGLGVWQMLPELRRDRWATLRHRPLPVGHLYLGKLLAGASLYLLAIGLPLLASLWLIGTPGHFAIPFVPASVEPALVDSLGGFSFYLAALLAVLEAGSLIRRALPVLAALLVTDFALDAQYFWIALAAQGALALALAVAGWGAVHARERWSARPWAGRAGALAVAVLGVAGLGHLVVLMSNVAGRTAQVQYESMEFLQDGRVIRETTVDGMFRSAVDLDGHPVSEAEFREFQTEGKTVRTCFVTGNIGSPHGLELPVYRPGYRQSPGYLADIGTYLSPAAEVWFFLGRAGRFVGLGLADKREVATFGPEGFAGPGVRRQGYIGDTPPYPPNGDPQMEWGPTAVKLIDFPKREILSLRLPPGDTISGAAPLIFYEAGIKHTYIGVALANRVAIFQTDGKLLAELPFDREMDRWGDINVGMTPKFDRFYLWYSPSQWIAETTKTKMPSYLEVLDAGGKLLSTREITPSPEAPMPPRWSDWVAGQLRTPVGWGVAKLWYASGRHIVYGVVQVDGSYMGSIMTQPVPSLVPLFLAVLLAPIAWLLARRAHAPPRECWGWALLTLAVGWVGPAVFWLCGERPKTKPCPRCAQPRRLDREACAHCGAVWGARPADGSEILEPALTGGLV